MGFPSAKTTFLFMYCSASFSLFSFSTFLSMLFHLFTRITTLVMKLPGYSMKQQFKGAHILLCFFFSLFLALFILSAHFRAKLHVGNTHNPGYFFA